MEGLFEAIFSNGFIILAAIAGIIGFFKDSFSKDTDTENERRKKPNKPAPPFGGGATKPASQPTKRPERVGGSISTASASEQKQQQMEQLAEQMGADLQEPLEDLAQQVQSVQSQRQATEGHLQKQKMKRQVANNFTREGLINGIIMSEVLGKPRGKKPYRSAVSEQIKMKQINELKR
ncbi:MULTISPECIES: hypothetical protein [Virgibacillus]|uniref:Uncharacterized protein n=1 Tax=Virgibacillus dokdonensis TaxID=302167 RepID=A0A2K9J8S0_9BACI|nr:MULTISPECIES: hypothetical protein [Virgibacillus]AUJ26230.1 hypothetical protein A21D_03190 [Virgibacillus dokdonensis]NWO12364.1 hypothetical protein [Virgibacillus sp.]